VFVPGLIQGRWLGAEDFEALRRLISEHPDWSRRRVSIALCEALNWRTASGQLKDMSARLLLNKLAERGLIKLPPRRRGGGRQILRALSEAELFSLHGGTGELIQCPLRALQPLEVILSSHALRKPMPLFVIWRSIITWASRASRARTCATSFGTLRSDPQLNGPTKMLPTALNPLWNQVIQRTSAPSLRLV